MLSGVALAAVIFGLFAALIGYGGHAPGFLVGARYPSPGLLPLARGSFEAADLNTAVKVVAEAEDPLRGIAAVYLKMIRALDVLDSDKDLVISSWEIFTAPTALRKLDINHDGKLSAEELGFSSGSTSAPKRIMKQHGVHA